jgi:hypothetical protein
MAAQDASLDLDSNHQPITWICLLLTPDCLDRESPHTKHTDKNKIIAGLE